MLLYTVVVAVGAVLMWCLRLEVNLEKSFTIISTVPRKDLFIFLSTPVNLERSHPTIFKVSEIRRENDSVAFTIDEDLGALMGTHRLPVRIVSYSNTSASTSYIQMDFYSCIAVVTVTVTISDYDNPAPTCPSDMMVFGHFIANKETSGHLPASKGMSVRLPASKGTSGHLPASKGTSDYLATSERVSGHLATSERLSGHLATSERLSGYLANSEILSGHLVNSERLSGHLAVSERVSGHLAAIKRVSGHLAASERLSGHPADSERFSSHLAASETEFCHLAASKRVSGHLAASQTVSSHLSASETVYDHIPSVAVHVYIRVTTWRVFSSFISGLVLGAWDKTIRKSVDILGGKLQRVNQIKTSHP